MSIVDVLVGDHGLGFLPSVGASSLRSVSLLLLFQGWCISLLLKINGRVSALGFLKKRASAAQSALAITHRQRPEQPNTTG